MLLLVGSQTQGDLQQLQKQEEARYRARSEAIALELKDLRGHAWAGIYSRTTGMTVESLSLAPRAGGAFASRGCLGLINFNHGEIRRSGADWIELAWQIDPGLSTFAYLGKRQAWLSPKLRVIPWGSEKYLVPEARLMEFVNAVNSGDRLLIGSFWRSGVVSPVVTQEPPDGRPELPESLRPCLFDAPVRCRCTKAREVTEPAGNGVQHVWRELEIDAGSAQKLRVGMCLFGGTVDIAGEIVEVRETSARVQFREFETNSQRTSLKVGSELTTRPPKR
jgi:hypothetical protein